MEERLIRLNKFISESGLCSRREADRYIAGGHVFLNGKRAQIGDQVGIGDKVRVNGNELEPRAGDEQIFIALNKPVGVISTTEEGVRENIIQFVNHSKRIFPVGRLDKDSQGLIFLTNNGDLVNKILRAGNKHEKEYVVTVDKPLTQTVIDGMAAGVQMLGVTTKKCKITQESPNRFRIILVQGLNRQIRRMCEFYGYEVTKLERVRIMHIDLKGLPPGDWRDLSEKEMEGLYKKLSDSVSTKKKVDKPSEKSDKKKSDKPAKGKDAKGKDANKNWSWKNARGKKSTNKKINPTHTPSTRKRR
ncbi:MAG: 23S rRNA pseudouridine(2604) synthase RluF [Bacteroidia bacterium]